MMFLQGEKKNNDNRTMQPTSFWTFIWIVCCTFVLSDIISPVNGIREHDGRKRRKLQTVGKFMGSFKVVKAGLPSATPLSETVLGVYNNRSTVNLTPFNNAGISLMIPFTCCFTSVAMTFGSITTVDTSAPYSLFGNVRQNFTNVPGLNVPGPKNIFVAGYSGSRLVATLNLSFIVIRSPLAPTAPAPVPVSRPVPVPVRRPVTIPVPVSVPIPIMVVPVTVAPTPTSICTIPKFLTPWKRYPVKPGGTVAVAQGGAIGTDFIVFGGYAGGLSSASNQTWAFNTPSQNWRELDNIPIRWGITHMPNVIVGNNIYACGGYWNGTDPGLPAQKQCFKYTHGNVIGSQWTSLPDLPDIRAGGAMIYDSKRNSVTYATGADFHSPNPPRAVDWPTVWELDLDNILAGWKLRTNTPYSANHVGTASILYRGVERHYVVGGQEAHNEFSGQYNLLYQYDVNGNTWTQRANLPNGTSHIQSSVFPYKECGFFVVGGKNNRFQVSRSVMYYDITTDQWSKVGDTPTPISASVCDTFDDATIYCQSGCIGCDFSWRIIVG